MVMSTFTYPLGEEFESVFCGNGAFLARRCKWGLSQGSLGGCHPHVRSLTASSTGPSCLLLPPYRMVKCSAFCQGLCLHDLHAIQFTNLNYFELYAASCVPLLSTCYGRIFDTTLRGITRRAVVRACTVDKPCGKGRIEKRFYPSHG